MAHEKDEKRLLEQLKAEEVEDEQTAKELLQPTWSKSNRTGILLQDAGRSFQDLR